MSERPSRAASRLICPVDGSGEAFRRSVIV
jgi:hypothetical protein